jgi:cytochrome oxidase Cu insertion factor (SCO1/SenC/PrrC family)
VKRASAGEVFSHSPCKLSRDEYNFHRFSLKEVMMDIEGTMAARGIGLGCPAPDFELESTEGKSIRLSQLEGMPAIVRFGSFT